MKYIRLEADERVTKRTFRFFTFEVPGAKFMPHIVIVCGMERYDYSHQHTW